MSHAAKTGERRFLGLQATLQSFTFVASHLGAAVRISGLWVALITLLSSVRSYVWSLMLELDEALIRDILLPVTMIVFALAFGSIAISWHRLVLRNERGRLLALPFADALRYVFLVGAACVAIAVPLIASLFAFDAAVETATEGAIIPLLIVDAIVCLSMLGFLLRFSLTLPALALGDREMTLRRSWRETKRAWVGLLRGTVIIAVPAFTAIRYLGFAYLITDGAEHVALASAYYVTAFVFVLIYATFLSPAYRQIVGSPERVSSAFE